MPLMTERSWLLSTENLDSQRESFASAKPSTKMDDVHFNGPAATFKECLGCSCPTRCEREQRCSIKHPYRSSKEHSDVPQLLRAAADTFEQRNAVYGDNYKKFGTLLLALFPDGIPAAKTEEEATRLHLLIYCAGKLQRYGYNFAAGGHRDSARDLAVYAAMLEEATS